MSVMTDRLNAQQLVHVLRTGEPREAWLAADTLQKIQIQNPKIIEPFSDQLFKALLKNPQKEVRWHLAQILPKLPLNERQLEHCIVTWEHGRRWAHRGDSARDQGH